MTTGPKRSRDRRNLPWDEHSLLPGRGGLPWWLAASLVLACTAAGAFTDIRRQDQLGVFFQTCYFLSCLLAVVAVQRKALFGPMVQPPLILVIAVPSVLVLAGSVPTEGEAVATALALGTPLINGFPTMAITTLVTLAVGAFRLFLQRRPTESSTPPSRRRAEWTAEAGPPAEPSGRSPGIPASPRPVPPPAPERAAERGRTPSPRPLRPVDAESVTEPVSRITGQPRKGYQRDADPRRRGRPQP